MEDFFRTVAIGLGVLLGTLNPGVEPEWQMSVHKAGGQLVVEGTLVRAISPKMEEALAEGIPMELTVRVEREGWAKEVSQTLVFLPLAEVWQVTRSGQVAQALATRTQAEQAWVSWTGLEGGTLPVGSFAVTVEAMLSFPGHPDWKADMVWKLPVVRWRRTFSGSSEIPF